MKTNKNARQTFVTRGKNNYYLLPFLLLLCSCQGPKFLIRHGLKKDTATVNLVQYPTDSISIHYIGCSGFFITKGSNTLLIDPYFTYKAGLKRRLTTQANIPYSLIKTIDNVFTRAIGSRTDDKHTIDALLISHAHVDHMGDVPYLYSSHHLNPQIPIIGSTTTGHYLHDLGIPNANFLRDIELSASSWLSNGKWVWVNNRLRVLPIVAEHGPHFRLLGRNRFLASTRHEMKDTKHRLPCRYGTGQTLSYLIDFLNDDGTVNFRLYHSSASGNSPNGFPPSSVLAEHRIDLEVLCAASFNQVKRYPEEIVRYLNPRHILVAHMEEFLVSNYSRIKRKPNANYFYNFRKFFKRLNVVMHDLNDRDRAEEPLNYTLPNVDTKMTFKY